MAIYYLHAGFVSRSSGRTSVQSAAYICGEKLHEDHRDKDIDYSNRASGVALVKTLAPENSKYKDISVWNEIENFEDRYAKEHFKSEETCEKYKSSVQTAQTLVLALPNELSIETCEELLDKFIDTRFTSRGLISTYAIHNAEGNLHAHVQISRRAIGKDGEFVTRKDREICTRSSLLETRKLWAALANEHLAKEGFKDRITEKSYEDLGINLEGEKHRGWYASSLGTDSVIAQENLEIAKRNEERILADPSIILNLLNEKQAVFTQKDILKEIGKRVLDDSRISAVFEKALESSIYVGESINGEFLYTGERYQQLESDVITKFEELSSREAKTSVDSKLSVINKYDFLSEEQKNAVIGLTSSRGVDVLIGKAGAGKTTAMQAVSDIYKNSSSRVIGMSLSAVASENLGKDAGIESATIASWSHKWRAYETAKEKFLSFNSIVTDGVLKQLDWYNDLQRYEGSQLKSGDVIIVDEAGMVGTKDWKEVLSAADKFGAKVIAVGDDNQFKAISAGDCFRQFIDQSKDSKEKIFALSEIRRQKEDWQREASVEFSKLNVSEALAMYEDRGRVQGLDQSEIYDHIAEKYLELEKGADLESRSAAVLCATNRECTAINDAVRKFKKERGELGDTVCSIQVSKSRDSLQEIEPYNRSNETQLSEFSERDRIVFLENNKQLGVKNGQTGIVTLHPKAHDVGANVLRVILEDGRQVDIDTKEYNKLDHGYAITLHKSQGKTYDNTIVLASKFMDAKAVYVGMTRHRDNVNLYYNNKDFKSFADLVSIMSKYAHKDSVEDYRSIENLNKARVFEYKETLLERSSVLKDINRGDIGDRSIASAWKEYHALKSNSIKLGREILNNYDSHKLYLDQLGITREKMEISVGLKQKHLNKVELEAKNTVALYAKASQETRSLYEQIKKSSGSSKDVRNITKSMDYGRYCDLRDRRNELAEQILSNVPLHRSFVNELSRESFISFKNMEKQVDYGRSLKAEQRGFDIDPERSANVSMYAYWSGKAQAAYEVMSKDIGVGVVTGYVSVIEDRVSEIKNHADYAKYQELVEKRDEYGREIAFNIDSYDKAILKHASEGISRKEIEERYVHKTEALREAQAANRELLSEIAVSFDMNRHFAADKEKFSYGENVNKYKISKEDLELQRKTEVSMYLSGDTRFISSTRIAEIKKEIEAEKTREVSAVEAAETTVAPVASVVVEEAHTQEKQQSLAQAEVSQVPTRAGSTNADWAEYSRWMLEKLRAEREGQNNAASEMSSKFDKSERFLREVKEMNIRNPEVIVSKFVQFIETSEFIRKQQEGALYLPVLDHHKAKEGYGLYVNNSMLRNYIHNNTLHIDAKEGINEYASMLIQQSIDNNKIKDVSSELIETSLKQAVCFEVLKEAFAENLKPESIDILHNKAEALSKVIGNHNIQALNNRELMERAVAEMEYTNRGDALPVAYKEQIIAFDQQENKAIKAQEISIEKDRSLEFSL